MPKHSRLYTELHGSKQKDTFFALIGVALFVLGAYVEHF